MSTPTRADKDRLTSLGLDLTEHAGKGYVEVVLYAAADELALRSAGFQWDVRIGDLLERELERIQLDEAARTAVSPLPSAVTQDVLGASTPRPFEQWTLSCTTADGLVGQAGVSVERGQTVDLGDVCDAGLDTGTGPEPTKPGKGGGKPETS